MLFFHPFLVRVQPSESNQTTSLTQFSDKYLIILPPDISFVFFDFILQITTVKRQNVFGKQAQHRGRGPHRQAGADSRKFTALFNDITPLYPSQLPGEQEASKSSLQMFGV